MLILALEHSTHDGSIALLRNSRVVAEAHWKDASPRRHDVVSMVRDLLAPSEHRLGDVDLYAVGTGPGAYTNLRTSVSLAQAWALPGRRFVLGISSAAALAADVAARHGARRVAVVGRARRNKLWLMQYTQTGGAPSPRGAMVLATESELDALLREGETIASPDWPQLRDTLQRVRTPSRRLIEEPCIPAATRIGKLAVREAPSSPRRMGPPARLSPLYIYPPVL